MGGDRGAGRSGAAREDLLAGEIGAGRVVSAHGPRLFSHECGYLPDRIALTEARTYRAMSPLGYTGILRAGYRRFADLFFRPRCLLCSLCIPYRVRAGAFRPTRSQRRAWRRNRGIEASVGPVTADEEAVEVANAFYRHRVAIRGWSPLIYTEESYAQQFVGGPVPALEVRYRLGARTLGIGLFDDLPDGQTAVIFHYLRDWAPQSPGAFNIQWLIERARARERPYVYLGYWVPPSPSTAYKARFQPGEARVRGRWVPVPRGHDATTPPLGFSDAELA